MTEPFPHLYAASADACPAGEVALSSPGLAAIVAGPAAQFGGSGAHWSPETLLPAAIANCFVLTFRAVSAASLFGWRRLECRVEGKVDRVARRPRFVRFRTLAILTIAAGADAAKARRLLAKADRDCLIANSLIGARDFEGRIVAAERR
jgi:organic hydroperoxide reductase OsmC/OhrA